MTDEKKIIVEEEKTRGFRFNKPDYAADLSIKEEDKKVFIVSFLIIGIALILGCLWFIYLGFKETLFSIIFQGETSEFYFFFYALIASFCFLTVFIIKKNIKLSRKKIIALFAVIIITFYLMLIICSAIYPNDDIKNEEFCSQMNMNYRYKLLRGAYISKECYNETDNCSLNDNYEIKGTGNIEYIIKKKKICE